MKKYITAPVIWFLSIMAIILWMIIFSSEDRTLANESLTFDLKPQKEWSEPWVIPIDLDRLATAVSHAETGGCKLGTARKYKNCVGIQAWTNGKRHPKEYASHQESLNDFKRIWSKHYKVYPTIKEAKKWTGNDNARSWLSIVNYYYSL